MWISMQSWEVGGVDTAAAPFLKSLCCPEAFRRATFVQKHHVLVCVQACAYAQDLSVRGLDDCGGGVWLGFGCVLMEQFHAIPQDV